MASIRGAAYVLLPRRPQAQSRITLHTRSATLSHSYPAGRRADPPRRRPARLRSHAQAVLRCRVGYEWQSAVGSAALSLAAGGGTGAFLKPAARPPAALHREPSSPASSRLCRCTARALALCAPGAREKKKRDRSRKPSAQPAARPAAPRKQDARSWQNRRLLSSAGSSGRNEKCHFSRAPWSKKRC